MKNKLFLMFVFACCQKMHAPVKQVQVKSLVYNDAGTGMRHCLLDAYFINSQREITVQTGTSFQKIESGLLARHAGLPEGYYLFGRIPRAASGNLVHDYVISGWQQRR